MSSIQKAPLEWFQTAFGNLYPLLYAHRDDRSAYNEAKNLINILGIQEKGLKILDVCCGSGRHADAFIDLGFDVTAFDLSPNLLKEAKKRVKLAGRLARADMRALPFSRSFDLVLNLFTSFGYFPEDEENERALMEMTRVLVPGGRLVLDHMNSTNVVQSLVKEDSKILNGYKVCQRRQIQGNRIVKEIDISTEKGKEMHLCENVRLYTPEEIQSLFQRQGLVDVKLYGAFNGETLKRESQRMIAVASKTRG